MQKFIPSAQTCGAAIKKEGQEAVVDDINHRIACMIAGFKDIYWGAASELNTIDEQFLPLENYSIGKIIIPAALNFGVAEGLLLYTPQGEKNARLFMRMLQQAINQKKLYKGGTLYNEYLAGMLLGYFEQDIEHYYKDVIKGESAEDKKKAEEFIARETPLVEEEMRREREKEEADRTKLLKKSLENLIEALNNLYKQLSPII